MTHTVHNMVMKDCMGSYRLDSQDSGGTRLVLLAAVSVSQPSAFTAEDKDHRETRAHFFHNFRFPVQICASAALRNHMIRALSHTAGLLISHYTTAYGQSNRFSLSVLLNLAFSHCHYYKASLHSIKCGP